MSSSAEIASALIGAIGENDEEATVTQWLDSGFPPFNVASSSRNDGGFPGGRMIEIAGPPSAGKTALATRAMASAQAAGGIAGFNDHERSFSLVLAPKLGLNVEPGRFVYKKPRTFEESISLVVQAATIIREKKLIDANAPICWVFDSLASMVPQSVLFDMKSGKDRDPTTRNMNDNTALARATSAHFPAFAQYCEELGICAIFLNQLRKNINVVYGDPTTTPGGDAPKFYFSQRILLSSRSIKNDKTKEITGNEVTGKFIKNKVTRPFLTATWRFMFQPDGTGRFDVERSLIEYLAEIGALNTPSNGYVEWEGKRIHKETLARKLQDEDRYAELVALMPPTATPVELDKTGLTSILAD